MEVARVATLRGHKVTIYEKSNVLGGVFIAAAAPSFKEKDRDLIKWYEKEIKDLNIEVKFNTEVKPEDIAKLGADEVVVATGSKARKLRVPGAEKASKRANICLAPKKSATKSSSSAAACPVAKSPLTFTTKARLPSSSK